MAVILKTDPNGTVSSVRLFSFSMAVILKTDPNTEMSARLFSERFSMAVILKTDPNFLLPQEQTSYVQHGGHFEDRPEQK